MTKPTNASIKVVNLIKKYRTAEKNAVDDISFEVPSGSFFTLLGPNGAGKTTTISILTTTLSKTSGTVTVAGFDTETQAAQVRQRIGIIFQKPSLDENLTAEENIRFHAILYGLYGFQPSFSLMPQEYQHRVRHLAELLGIANELNQPIKTFSGGMKRKLEIIRSLMHQPQILFLDEPTTGLDPASRQHLWEYLQQVRAEQGTTIFLTTHYLEEAEGADQVCIINHGRIITQGTPTQIKQQLLQPHLLVDAGDRNQLTKELKKHKFAYSGEGPFKIQITTHSSQAMIKAINTPLTHLQINNPTLEEAYLKVISQSGSNA